MIVPLSFIPGKASPELQEIFADPIARKLWLLWRSGHVVSQHFTAALWRAVDAIKQQQPRDVDGFCRCFPPAMDFSENDLRRFAVQYILQLVGEEPVQHLNACECGKYAGLEIIRHCSGEYFVFCPACGLESDRRTCTRESLAVDHWNAGMFAERSV